MMQRAPFTAPPVEIAPHRAALRRASGWGEQPELALLREYDQNRHWTRTFIVDVDDPKPQAAPRSGTYSTDEHYKDPG